MNSTTPPTRRNPWPIAIVTYFICFGAFTAGLVVFAARQNEDLVSNKYYDEEIRYQGQINKNTRASAIADQVHVTYSLGTAQIQVQLPLPETTQVSSGLIRFYRPSDASQDREEKLALDATGNQLIDAKSFAQGYWKVRLEWTAEGQEFALEKPLLIGPVKCRPEDNKLLQANSY